MSVSEQLLEVDWVNWDTCYRGLYRTLIDFGIVGQSSGWSLPKSSGFRHSESSERREYAELTKGSVSWI